MKTVSMLLSSTVFGLTLVSANANAKAPVYFKTPINFAGTGCPSGSASLVKGKNTSTLNIKFDQFEAGKDAAHDKSRASCSFAVPVHVAEGYQVSVLSADWQGYAKGQAEFKRKYFFAGNPNVPTKTSHIDTEQGKKFSFKDSRLHQSMNFSACGEDKILRINSSVRAADKHSSIKLKSAVKFQVQWKRCS